LSKSRLAGIALESHISLMKLIILLVSGFAFSALMSCESTSSRKAGGAAFSDSHLARQLDSSTPLDDPETPGSASYEQWRDKE